MTVHVLIQAALRARSQKNAHNRQIFKLFYQDHFVKMLKKKSKIKRDLKPLEQGAYLLAHVFFEYAIAAATKRAQFTVLGSNTSSKSQEEIFSTYLKDLIQDLFKNQKILVNKLHLASFLVHMKSNKPEYTLTPPQITNIKSMLLLVQSRPFTETAVQKRIQDLMVLSHQLNDFAPWVDRGSKLLLFGCTTVLVSFLFIQVSIPLVISIALLGVMLLIASFVCNSFARYHQVPTFKAINNMTESLFADFEELLPKEAEAIEEPAPFSVTHSLV